MNKQHIELLNIYVLFDYYYWVFVVVVVVLKTNFRAIIFTLLLITALL